VKYKRFLGNEGMAFGMFVLGSAFRILQLSSIHGLLYGSKEAGEEPRML
jgi:hypothetical protein